MKRRKFNNRAFLLTTVLYWFISYLVEFGLEWFEAYPDFGKYASFRSIMNHIVGAILFGIFFGIFGSFLSKEEHT